MASSRYDFHEHLTTKYKKSEVSYESPAKGEHHCSQCVHFEVQAPQHCEIVAGVILDGDWCKKFKEKK